MKKINKRTQTEMSNPNKIDKKSLQDTFLKRIERCDASERELLLKLYNEIIEDCQQ